MGRPSVPPVQAFLALPGRLRLGISSERKLIMEAQCNLALRSFVGLGIQEQAWDASTFGQNRRRRFDGSGVLEHLLDETVKRAFARRLISTHVSADGTQARANASFKSCTAIAVAMSGEEHKRQVRAEDDTQEAHDRDAGNPSGNFRGEKRSNAKHRSKSDSDCRFDSKGSSAREPIPAIPSRR